MHEYALLNDLLNRITAHCGGQITGPVELLRIRRGWGVAEDAIRQAFEMQAQGTHFENARLEVLRPEARFRCVCGKDPDPRDLERDHHVWICPACQKAQPVPGGHDLEVLDVELRA